VLVPPGEKTQRTRKKTERGGTGSSRKRFTTNRREHEMEKRRTSKKRTVTIHHTTMRRGVEDKQKSEEKRIENRGGPALLFFFRDGSPGVGRKPSITGSCLRSLRKKVFQEEERSRTIGRGFFDQAGKTFVSGRSIQNLEGDTGQATARGEDIAG